MPHDYSNNSLHLKNLFEEGELDPAATVKESLTVQIEGSREVQRTVNLYNLDAILAVGYLSLGLLLTMGWCLLAMAALQQGSGSELD